MDGGKKVERMIKMVSDQVGLFVEANAKLEDSIVILVQLNTRKKNACFH